MKQRKTCTNSSKEVWDKVNKDGQYKFNEKELYYDVCDVWVRSRARCRPTRTEPTTRRRVARSSGMSANSA